MYDNPYFSLDKIIKYIGFVLYCFLLPCAFVYVMMVKITDDFFLIADWIESLFD